MTMAAGAVANLQTTREAVRTARAVMEHTTHTLLAGEQADAFAGEMGIPSGNLSTEVSLDRWRQWCARGAANIACQQGWLAYVPKA